MAKTNKYIVAKAKEDSLRPARLSLPQSGRYNSVLEAAAIGRCSAKKAIKAKCIVGCGMEDVQSRVEGCTVYSCPLHAFRPYQKTARIEAAVQE
jgi:hypothetical protein